MAPLVAVQVLVYLLVWYGLGGFGLLLVQVFWFESAVGGILSDFHPYGNTDLWPFCIALAAFNIVVWPKVLCRESG